MRALFDQRSRAAASWRGGRNAADSIPPFLAKTAAKDLNHHILRSYAAADWEWLAGFARIEKVRSTADSVRYLSKYIAKGGEIDVSANLATIPARLSNGDIQVALLELERS